MNSVLSRTSKIDWLVAILLLFLGLIALSSSFHAPFLWDDYGLIVENPQLKSWNIGKLFTSPFFHFQSWTSGDPQIRYRPLTMLSFWLDYRIWELEPFGYHLTNFILHWFNALLLYAIGLFLTKKRWFGFLIASLFIIHPVHPMAVSFIPSRGDLLAGMGTLGLLLVHMVWRKRGRLSAWIGLVEMLLLAGALFSIETAVMAPFILVAYELILLRDEPPKNGVVRKGLWAEGVGLGLVGLSYLFLRVFLFPVGKVSHGLPWSVHRLQVFGQSMTLCLNWFLLARDIRFPVTLDKNFPVWIGIASWFAIIALVLWIVFSKTPRDHRIKLFQFGCIAGWIAVFPVSNSVFGIGTFASPNYLYSAAMGFLLALVALGWTLGQWVTKGWKRPYAYALCGLAALGLHGWWLHQTWQVNRWVTDPTQFFATALQVEMPYTSYAYDWVAFHRLNQKNPDYEKLLELLGRGIQKYPHSALLYQHLGVVYQALGRNEWAKSAYRTSIELASVHSASGDSWAAYQNLAVIALEEKNYSEALEMGQLVVRLAPEMHETYGVLAQVLWSIGKQKEALAILQQGIASSKDDRSTLYTLQGDYLLVLNQPVQAAAAYQAALHSSKDPSVYSKLALAWVQSGDIAKALQAHQKGIRRYPADPDLYLNYGVTLANSGQFSEAKEQWKKAQRLAPQRKDITAYLQKVSSQ